MKVRSITIFSDIGYPPNRLLLDQFGIFARHAVAEFSKIGVEVETIRLATPPFPEWMPLNAALPAAQELSIETSAVGINYLSLGPALPKYPGSYQLIPEILAGTKNVFMSGLVTTAAHELDFAAAKSCAELIISLASIESNGFGNLYFSALANVKPFGPFFPTGYAEFGQPAFALAVEGASLALEAFSEARSLAEARSSLIRRVEEQASKLTALSQKLADSYGYLFKGIDFTLAPHPDANASITRALEALGLPKFGEAGSVAVSAFVTDSLDRARYLRTGFNGLMLPVLEDSTLAARSLEGHLGLHSFLLCSAVCGTGLDVIPLPGDTSAEQIFPLILDMASLALRLDKQLTARLMPIPGKTAGQATAFDFDYFANGGILPLHAQQLKGLLANAGKLEISPKYPSDPGV